MVAFTDEMEVVSVGVVPTARSCGRIRGKKTVMQSICQFWPSPTGPTGLVALVNLRQTPSVGYTTVWITFPLQVGGPGSRP